MRPTLREQLRGIRRILGEVVAPEVRSPYPADTLRAVLASLETLEAAWDRVLPFLHWDNAETAALLAEAEPRLAAPLAARVRSALDAKAADPLDFDAVHARNGLLRALLADAVPQLAGGGEPAAAVYARVRTHLRERMSREPLSMPAPAPAGRQE